MELDDAKQTYVAESRDLLQNMEDLLLQAETSGPDADAINAMFRAAHTVKGSAGLFGFDAIVAFTHVVENALDKVRDGALPLDKELIALLLECGDHIGTLVTEIAELGNALNDNVTATGVTLLERLHQRLGRSPAQGDSASGAVVHNAVTPAEACVDSVGGGVVESEAWHLSLRFRPDVFRHGMDPLSFIAYLGEIGTIVHVATLVDAMPAAAEMDPESCYLGFEIDLKSERDRATIDGAFDFVREDCDIRILAPRSKLAEYVRLIEDLPEDSMRLGEILVKGGALTQRELDAALAQQQAQPEAPEAKRLGEILVDSKATPQPVVKAALDKQKQVDEKRLLESRLVKVHADKLDNLINLVGELVIAGAAAGTLAQKNKDVAMIEATFQVARLVEEIRDSALRLRMVQIGETFNRFPRIVRDVSKELGKDIELQISGAETELDKSMVERLADPLVHLVRNAVDHGIEAAALRTERGKPARGVVRLNAYHDSGSVVIEIGDDGGGLSREKVRRKAVEKGLIADDQALSDAEIYKLILEPGFSTAEQITNLSGRGVGMDVVKKNIEALRGNVEITSNEGAGTTVRLRLPLTLAIIDGFLVQVGKAFYVVPLEMVHECIELSAGAREASHGHNYINLRGEVLPFLRLRDMFGSDDPAPARENVVVVQYGGKRAGLVVDGLLGEFQTVIKPLSKLFAQIKGIAGSTILGTGEVALIVDAAGLVQHAVSSDSHTNGSRSESSPHSAKQNVAPVC